MSWPTTPPGKVVLWWRGEGRFPARADGAFRSLVSRDGFSCAVQANASATVRCWGPQGSVVQAGLANASTAPYLAAAGARACAVLASGAALCSGSNASAGALPQDLFGYGLAVGDSHACALRRPDHTAVCWTLGGPTTTLYEPALGISFGFLVAGGNFTCGVASSDFSVYCWSAGAVAASVPLPRIRPGVCVSDDSSFLLQRSFSSVIDGTAYVGFSSATGILFYRHYMLGWSFRMNGAAPPLNVSSLPILPVTGPRRRSRALEIVLPIASAALVFTAAAAVFAFLRRRRMYAELREDWEASFGPHRFSYKDLFHATDGFSDKRLLGIGGFGRVYRGALASKMEVAVKKVAHGSRQGMREFVAEVVSIGRLRHRNLVQLLGYCRRKGELLLVYDDMPNGSLDRCLYDRSRTALSWGQRFRIIKGIASGLLYLHKDWEQVVVHRDIKASNVLLDKEMNVRLGDFGLARLYDLGYPYLTCLVVLSMGKPY
ncbi:L-type lectin-domain containing receptor kinase IV.2 [Zea mays]|uniref:non-specific serine/threonine protein kinase n=1 Tax=Zea mays TaxID=4577 RepID=A0A3L6D6E4_MAIZE|nr:L-type lectin-domain containing receptor kinase IV.2 [Zea mays]